MKPAGNRRNSRFHGLAFRYGFFILSGILVIFIVAFTYTFSFTYKILLEDARQNASNVTQLTIAKIQHILLPIEEVPDLMVQKLEYPENNTFTILKTLREFVLLNKEVYGSCLAFEPYKFDPGRKYYAPYFYQKGDSIISKNLGGGDYDYFRMGWYSNAKRTGKSCWSEPYYDKGGGDMLMCTYSVPFYRMEGGKKVFTGVVTMDISLSSLRQIVDSIRVYKSGFGFLISNKGTMITFPDTTLINRDLFAVSRKLRGTNIIGVFEDMMKRGSGFVRLRNIHQEKPSWMFYSPVASTGWSLGLIFPSQDLFASFYDFSYRLVTIFLLSVMTMLVLIILITRKFTKPLTTLVNATRLIGQGDFRFALPVYRSKDEITQLANSFNLMQEELQVYIQNLKETTSAKNRLESELDVARNIQMGMLPGSFPQRDDLEIAAKLEPARIIGGDLYDFFLAGDDRLYFAIGDVSGKGVPASLFMAITRTLFRSRNHKEEALNLIMAGINRELCRDNPNQMFVTFIAGMLDLKTGSMELCNGGHNPPLILRKNGIIEKIVHHGGIPFGIYEDTPYSTFKTTLEEGETLVLYTDGITEAANIQHQLFGEENLIKLLSTVRELNPGAIVSTVFETVKTFAGEAEQSDDNTMLLVKFRKKSTVAGLGSPSLSSGQEIVRLKISNRVAEISKLVDLISDLEKRWSLPAAKAKEINLALEELVSNIIFYAYEDEFDHSVDIEFSKQPGTIIIRIEDDGKEFNILEADSDIDNSLGIDERPVGGLGIHFIKTFMNKIEYSREGGKNIVVLTKEL
ncbi:MAG: SpoIIE family protein phosphatase [Bacteroidetes bacterium]|nr:SpoIIE family protein phosphatase [Bacteroidota bacterium]